MGEAGQVREANGAATPATPTGPRPAATVCADTTTTGAPLQARIVTDAVVYPTIRVASRPGKLLMGVYDGDGGYVEGSALDRRSGEQGAPMPRDLFPDVTETDDTEAIYAGTLYFHYGHFLLESLARAWYAAKHPELPFVWAGSHDWQRARLRPWQTELLELLGLTNPTVILADPTRFARLHVPEVGYRYDDRFHPAHARFLGRYPGPPQVPRERLWLSRAGIGTDVRDLNAAALERQLRRAGWTIGHPESSTVRQQLDQLCRAEVVAGEEGSAFHTLMLLENLSGKRFEIFRRRGAEHRNLRTIGDVRGVDQHFHTLDTEVVLKAEGRAVSKVSPNSAELLDLLGEPVPPPRHRALTLSERAARRVLAAAAPRRLLDVGATDTELLGRFEIDARVAVSTVLEVDPRSCMGVDCYELPLDRYAEWFATERGTFDAIRISAPSYRELIDTFRTSTALAHERTLWVLGSGDRAARAAEAVRLTHPGYRSRRMLAGRRIVFVVERRPGSPRTDAEVEEFPLWKVKRRLRRVPLTVPRPVRPGRLEAFDHRNSLRRLCRLLLPLVRRR